MKSPYLLTWRIVFNIIHRCNIKTAICVVAVIVEGLQWLLTPFSITHVHASLRVV